MTIRFRSAPSLALPIQRRPAHDRAAVEALAAENRRVGQFPPKPSAQRAPKIDPRAIYAERNAPRPDPCPTCGKRPVAAAPASTTDRARLAER